jgi:hypothetical protein
LIVSVVTLLLGLLAGRYFEHRHAEREMTDVINQMQQPIESSEQVHALRAVRAIQMIDSGESSNAVQLLSRPIADYYYFHAELTHNDERTKDVLAMIERLAITNALIAEAIHTKIQ